MNAQGSLSVAAAVCRQLVCKCKATCVQRISRRTGGIHKTPNCMCNTCCFVRERPRAVQQQQQQQQQQQVVVVFVCLCLRCCCRAPQFKPAFTRSNGSPHLQPCARAECKGRTRRRLQQQQQQHQQQQQQQQHQQQQQQQQQHSWCIRSLQRQRCPAASQPPQPISGNPFR